MLIARFLVGTLLVMGASVLLTGCKKKDKEIRISTVRTPRKTTTKISKKGKVIRKFSEYRPMHRMTYEELKEEKYYLELTQDLHLLTLYLEQMIKVCAIQDDLAALRLQLADIYYKQDNFKKAMENYENYTDLYPGSQYADYAAYRAIETRAKKLPTPDRDQAATIECVERCLKYLKNHDAKNYEQQVTQILHDARYRLYMSEVLTFYFYLNRGALLGAKQRLDYIKKNNLKDMPELQAEVMVLEYELALAVEDTQSAQATREQLEKDANALTTLNKKQQKHLEKLKQQEQELLLKREQGAAMQAHDATEKEVAPIGAAPATDVKQPEVVYENARTGGEETINIEE